MTITVVKINTRECKTLHYLTVRSDNLNLYGWRRFFRLVMNLFVFAS